MEIGICYGLLSLSSWCKETAFIAQTCWLTFYLLLAGIAVHYATLMGTQLAQKSGFQVGKAKHI